MMSPFFDFLETLSPWWWLAFGVGLGAIEMLTFSFFLIWPAAAAVAMALILALVPGMPGEVQISVFAGLAVVLTWIGRSILRNFGDGGEVSDHPINERSAQLVGRKAKVVRFAGGEGTVEIDGIPWRAIGDIAPRIGAMVQVIDHDGTRLTVADLNSDIKNAG